MTAEVKEMTVGEWSDILMEIQDQPRWRHEADMDADYYDGKQLDAETLQAIKDLGMAPIIENLVAPTVDSVLGQEAKNRQDWRVTPAGDDRWNDVADAMNQKLNEAEREAKADRACSDAFAAQIKAGLGWVGVGREHDPFKFPFKAEYVHRNEVFWDWKDQDPGLEKCRWLARMKWHDADTLALAFPDKAELILSAGSGWSTVDLAMLADGGVSTGLARDYAQEQSWTVMEQEWRETYRKRLCLAEVWYRRWVRGKVLKAPDGRVVEYNPADQRHRMVVEAGMIEPRDALYSKVRLAWWIGPHKLADVPNPYKHGRIPYVPFFGKREDTTGVPYGMIRAMRPLQDEINARNTKMIWLLTAKRVTMTKGVADVNITRSEAARADAVHVLDAAKMREGGIFNVESDFALNEQQYKSLVDKREALKNAAGVYASYEGKASGATSGLAINSLVEQSSQTLAEITDNYRFARAAVGELLLGLVIEDIGSQPMQVKIKREFATDDKVIPLNQPLIDGGREVLNNDVQRARLKVALSDVPSTASYRQQRLLMLTEITKSLPPEIQAQLIDFVVASTDLPEREVIIDRLRKALNLGGPQQPKTPEEAQAMQEAQAKQAEVEDHIRQSAALERAEKQANIEKTIAETRAKIADLEDRQAARMQAGQPGQDAAQQFAAQLDALQKDYLAKTEEQARQVDEVRRQAEARTAAVQAGKDAEIEKARIAADANVRVAEITAASADAVAALKREIADLRAEIERAGERPEQDEPEVKAAPLPPININVQVEGGKPVKRTGKIVPDDHGGFTIESTPDDKTELDDVEASS